MKRAQVAAYLIFALQQSHAAHIYWQPNQLELNVKDNTEMIKTLPIINLIDYKNEQEQEEIQLFKRGRGAGRARRRAERKAEKAAANGQPAAQHQEAPNHPPAKGGISKKKAALMVAGGAVAGAVATKALSGGGGGGGGGGDPNAAPPA